MVEADVSGSPAYVTFGKTCEPRLRGALNASLVDKPCTPSVKPHDEKDSSSFVLWSHVPRTWFRLQYGPLLKTNP